MPSAPSRPAVSLAVVCVVALSLLISRPAKAQAPGTPGTTPATTGPGAAPTPGNPDDALPPAGPGVPGGVVEDANSGRQFIAPTALAAPAGTWAFHSYELFFVGLTYAATDRFSISLTTLPPILEDLPLVLVGSAKLKLIESSGWHMAASAVVAHGSDDGDGVTGGLFGGAVTRCLDRDCHSTLNGYAAAGVALDPDADQSAVPIVVSLGLTQRITPRIKLLLEGDFGAATNEIDDLDDGFLLWYGARITSRNLGVDLGFARPICGDDCDGSLVLGLPWIGFSYRPI